MYWTWEDLTVWEAGLPSLAAEDCSFLQLPAETQVAALSSWKIVSPGIDPGTFVPSQPRRKKQKCDFAEPQLHV